LRVLLSTLLFIFFFFFFFFFLFKGELPNPIGECVSGTKNSVVTVGGGLDTPLCGVKDNPPCASLNYAIYGSLDVGSDEDAVVKVVDSSALNQSVGITGWWWVDVCCCL
jgi:hypothetical protein